MANTPKTPSTQSSPKILITGASGTVGSLVAKELQAHKPRLAFHSEAKAQAARAKGADAVVVDFHKPETLAAALAGIDTLFLLGTGIRGQKEGEINVVHAAKKAGVKRVVKLSVLGADQDYALGKLHRAVEQAIEASGLAYTFLRPSAFMQNFVNYMGDTIKNTGRFFEPAGDSKLGEIDARDIARVAARVLSEPGRHDGKAYDLTGATAISYSEAAAIMTNVLGKPVQYVAVSDADARKGMLDAGMPDFYADALVDLNQKYREGLGATVSTAVQDITGKPPTSFEQFVRDYAGAWR